MTRPASAHAADELSAAVAAVRAVVRAAVARVEEATAGEYCRQTRPLARPPKGTQKKSLDAAVA